jgi:hypothetical protein
MRWLPGVVSFVRLSLICCVASREWPEGMQPWVPSPVVRSPLLSFVPLQGHGFMNTEAAATFRALSLGVGAGDDSSSSSSDDDDIGTSLHIPESMLLPVRGLTHECAPLSAQAPPCLLWRVAGKALLPSEREAASSLRAPMSESMRR